LPAAPKLDLWETIIIEEQRAHSHLCIYFDENTNRGRS
jgi:hypothetical protein